MALVGGKIQIRTIYHLRFNNDTFKRFMILHVNIDVYNEYIVLIILQ